MLNFFFLITHNPITDAEMNFFFPTASPMICRDEETHVRYFGLGISRLTL